MKNIYLACILLLVCTSLVKNSFAQDSDDESSESKKSKFKAGITYLSDNVYQGRKDSVPIPYLSTSLGYYAKSGFYINSTISYAPNESQIDVIDLAAGYTFSHQNWDGDFSLTKHFYSSKSVSVKSEVSADATGSLGYDIGFIKPTLSSTYNFGNGNDIALSTGLEHSFSAMHDRLDITPTFSMNAGTQNYYNAYFKKRKYAVKRNGQKTVVNVTGQAMDAGTFKVMDYECSLPLEYTVHKFTFTFTPYYVMPVNPNQIELTAKSSTGTTIKKTYTEKLQNSFYWSMEIYVSF